METKETLNYRDNEVRCCCNCSHGDVDNDCIAACSLTRDVVDIDGICDHYA